MRKQAAISCLSTVDALGLEAATVWKPGKPTKEEPGEPVRAGRVQLKGRTVGVRVRAKDDRQESTVRAVRGREPAGGNDPEILVEGAFFYNAAQNGGGGGGIGSTLRYNFLFGTDAIVPFLDANFGVIGMNLDLNRQSDGFNFNVGFGGGIHWFISHTAAITTELRWQHISNAGTEQPNDGINTALFLVGASYFFP